MQIQVLSGVLQIPESKVQFGKAARPRHLRRRARAYVALPPLLATSARRPVFVNHPHPCRRTRSHNRFLHQRRPNVKLGSTTQASHCSSAFSVADQHCHRLGMAMHAVYHITPKNILAVHRASCTEQSAIEQAPDRPLNRAQRRRRAAKSGTQHQGPRRLETHVWHAKRFRMVTRCSQLSGLHEQQVPGSSCPGCG